MNQTKTLSPSYRQAPAHHFSFRSFIKKIKARFLDAVLFSLLGRMKD